MTDIVEWAKQQAAFMGDASHGRIFVRLAEEIEALHKHLDRIETLIKRNGT